MKDPADRVTPELPSLAALRGQRLTHAAPRLAPLLPCGCYRRFCPACHRPGFTVGAWRAYRAS